MSDRVQTRLVRREGPLKCRDVAKVLQRYLDGEADAALVDRISEHLDDCRDCGLEASTYERLKEALATRRAEVPADSVDRLRDFGRRLAAGDIDDN